MKEEKELILSEERARRLWERAAQLQAEASLREEAVEGDPDTGETKRELIAGVEDESAGYSLAHIKEAGREVGIEPDFVELALAEEAILELEGGGESNFWDRTFEAILGDRERLFEVRRAFPLPSRLVWLALEKNLTSGSDGLELLEVRGGHPDEGGIAIFETPYAFQRSGSLPYWATVAETRRFMIRVTPEAEGECVVLVSAPLRRSRRWHGVLGIVLSGLGGVLGGGFGIGIAAVVVGTGGGAALPVMVGLAAGGVLGGERLFRVGAPGRYRRALRSLGKAFQKILDRVEQDVQRDLEAQLPPGA